MIVIFVVFFFKLENAIVLLDITKVNIARHISVFIAGTTSALNMTPSLLCRLLNVKVSWGQLQFYLNFLLLGMCYVCHPSLSLTAEHPMNNKTICLTFLSFAHLSFVRYSWFSTHMHTFVYILCTDILSLFLKVGDRKPASLYRKC